MTFIDNFVKTYQKILPGPFTIAIILTFFTFLCALIIKPNDVSLSDYSLEILGFWEEGLWDPSTGGLYFAFQMMLMLVLGHVLALSKPISKFIDLILIFCKDSASSAFFVTFTTILVAFFSWGFALIFGAILARKIGEKFKQTNQSINYGLIGACGYVGLMVWHGGLSGSAPLKASEIGNLKSMLPHNLAIPESIPITETVLSTQNLIVFLSLLIILPITMYFIGKKTSGNIPDVQIQEINTSQNDRIKVKGAEQIDNSNIPGILLGGLIIIYILFKLIKEKGLSIDPNFINLFLLGACLFLHKSFNRFTKSVGHAIGDATGILIQFPLYFGIIGIMKSSGMIDLISGHFVEFSTANSFPIITFFSAGLINIFVPSGGGQWVVQGPIIIQAAQDLGISYGKIIMSLAYGDQLTNMLQPFWALPLLGITGLKAKKILPYTLILFILGFIIFGVGILLF